MLHEGVRLMAVHAGLALHEGVRLQLRHLVAMTGFAGAQRRRAGEVLGGGVVIAHGALDAIGAMRAGLPLVIDRFMAGGAGISGWNEPMENVSGLLLLSAGRLDGNDERKEKDEQGGAQHTRAETGHGKILLSVA